MVADLQTDIPSSVKRPRDNVRQKNKIRWYFVSRNSILIALLFFCNQWRQMFFYKLRNSLTSDLCLLAEVFQSLWNLIIILDVVKTDNIVQRLQSSPTFVSGYPQTGNLQPEKASANPEPRKEKKANGAWKSALHFFEEKRFLGKHPDTKAHRLQRMLMGI